MLIANEAHVTKYIAFGPTTARRVRSELAVLELRGDEEEMALEKLSGVLRERLVNLMLPDPLAMSRGTNSKC